MIPFVGRKNELESLSQLTKKKVASLVVIKGRRRVGKSRLVEEFARGKKFLTFSGLAPTEGTTLQSQLDDFSRQLSEQMGTVGLSVNDWGAAFTLLAQQTKTGQAIILLDEISWMGSKDPDFLGKLKTAWDVHFKKNPKIMLIVCGSVSSWIEKNIISSTGFFGRISLKITLGELSLKESHELLRQLGFRCSVQEEFMILSIAGGIPWYMELFNPVVSTSENIKKLCFEPDGQLVTEFNQIFHDLFGRRGEICKKIVDSLSTGSAEYSEIASTIGYQSSGPLSEYLDDLIMAGFLDRDFTWNLLSKKASRLSRYRLKDNYLRFYLKYISENMDKIKKGQYKNMSLSSLPGVDSILGFQFENLVLNNRALIHKKLTLHPDEIVYDNPFFQRKTTARKGCQIDYMIQNKYGTLFVCEIKFSRNRVGMEVINEVKEKIARLKYPKGFAPSPILIHINGVQDEVINSGYFTEIIDFGEFFL